EPVGAGDSEDARQLHVFIGGEGGAVVGGGGVAGDVVDEDAGGGVPGQALNDSDDLTGVEATGFGAGDGGVHIGGPFPGWVRLRVRCRGGVCGNGCLC